MASSDDDADRFSDEIDSADEAAAFGMIHYGSMPVTPAKPPGSKDSAVDEVVHRGNQPNGHAHQSSASSPKKKAAANRALVQDGLSGSKASDVRSRNGPKLFSADTFVAHASSDEEDDSGSNDNYDDNSSRTDGDNDVSNIMLNVSKTGSDASSAPGSDSFVVSDCDDQSKANWGRGDDDDYEPSEVSFDTSEYESDENDGSESMDYSGGEDGSDDGSDDDDDGDWQIDENYETDDKAGGKGSAGRYYVPVEMKSVRCFNCDKEGHLSRDCKQPRKRQPCFLCGDTSHMWMSCPLELCFNCNFPGHRKNQCRLPLNRRHERCTRCSAPGHIEARCTDLWRQYRHIRSEDDWRKLRQGKLPPPRETAKGQWYCYNCGRKGHLGHECLEQRPRDFPGILFPHISRFDSRALHGTRTMPLSSRHPHDDRPNFQPYHDHQQHHHRDHHHRHHHQPRSVSSHRHDHQHRSVSVQKKGSARHQSPSPSQHKSNKRKKKKSSKPKDDKRRKKTGQPHNGGNSGSKNPGTGHSSKPSSTSSGSFKSNKKSSRPSNAGGSSSKNKKRTVTITKGFKKK